MGQKTVPEKTENFEKAFYGILADGFRKEAAYDYLILFSGGKDSMYIAHKLKQAKGGRICLLTVENGLEEESFLSHAKDAALKLGCDLFIFQPPAEQFIRFYRFLITEPSLKAIDTNPMCFFCARYIMALGVSFAEKMNIPFVLYGATPEQINRGQIPGTLRDIEIFEMVSRRAFMGYFRRIQSLPPYQADPVVKRAVDAIFHVSKTVRLMFPFQFLPYHVEEIKQILGNEYRWQNPIEGLGNDQYLTSGCKMVRLFGVLARKAGFIPHELEQFKKDYESGIVSEAAYRYNQNLLETIMEAEITPEVAALAKRLGLEEKLL
jgi:hypothetical protein